MRARPWWTFTATSDVTLPAQPTARSTRGTLPTGQRALGLRRVSGCSRVPEPAASTMATTRSVFDRLGPMESRRWVNPGQPQTLQIAVFLLYFNAAFTALFGGLFSVFGLLLIAGGAGAGFGIANERKWAYVLGIVMSVLPFALRYYVYENPFAGVGLLSLMFEIALVALLVHPQSRDYQRIWFK